MMMMVEVYTAESNGRDIRRCSMIGSRWVCLTIIDQYGRVTSDNVMTRERWVRSNHIGRYILKATARDILSILNERAQYYLKGENDQKHIAKKCIGKCVGRESW